jgi:hypothetical protein
MWIKSAYMVSGEIAGGTKLGIGSSGPRFLLWAEPIQPSIAQQIVEIC